MSILTFAPKMVEFIKRVLGVYMFKKPPLYNEAKATQVAGLLLKQNDGRMNLLKFTKIVYNIEREALKRWSLPVTYSNICSMRAGQVLSEIHDNTKQHVSAPIWKEYIDTNRKTNTVSLKKECSMEKLNRAEISLIKEIYQRDKNKTIDQLKKEHHEYPEYVDPGNSSIKTDLDKLLSILGKSQEEIRELKSDIHESARVRELVG
jgi:uncharacterized phage-associated protein